MHGFTRGLEKRLRALELRLGAVDEPETATATARRLEFVRAAHADLVPADLEPHERLTFSRIVASLPILQELRDEGIVGDDGQPAGADPHSDDPHEDRDEDEDAELAWVP